MAGVKMRQTKSKIQMRRRPLEWLSQHTAHVLLGRTAKTYSIQSILFPQAEKPKTGVLWVNSFIMVVLNQWLFEVFETLARVWHFQNGALFKWVLLLILVIKNILSVNEEICCRCLSRVLKVTVVSYKCFYIFGHVQGLRNLVSGRVNCCKDGILYHFWKNLIT